MRIEQDRVDHDRFQECHHTAVIVVDAGEVTCRMRRDTHRSGCQEFDDRRVTRL
ncbi:Uncharacterised protein [Mycobacteroides abscessus subsp. abscessus]|nr:Uncharacterised protein [Mycobacteroides abscessus subsp. abscessus]